MEVVQTLAFATPRFLSWSFDARLLTPTACCTPAGADFRSRPIPNSHSHARLAVGLWHKPFIPKVAQKLAAISRRLAASSPAQTIRPRAHPGQGSWSSPGWWWTTAWGPATHPVLARSCPARLNVKSS